ncbi:Herpes_UL92 domain-containing protein/F-box-like domain-containing protein [Cephalotus follicularis]|uniref:Herpes_UL92 domain-containing protein/F-box-like domain-containing protein n=1 Tax=Cephalotus follicularis TaxID=3775 RepID=A0A1Q3CJK2_CEPFO|nr:Herpes_UL92 domain-containing protein/F-box-like domain-containing protein [Cephalotus follicularis]
MTISDDEDESLALFLESEVLSVVTDQKEEETETKMEPKAKRLRVEIEEKEKLKVEEISNVTYNYNIKNNQKRIESGIFSKIPADLFTHILKFLSSEDLISCALVCRFLNYAAADESLWRRLYCLRWGLLPPTKKLRESAWKKLYIQRDEEDMIELVRNCQPEFKEYYIQMQYAKRSQAPLPSQLKDDCIIPDKTLADQVSIWKSNKGLSDTVVTDHACSGETCTYYQIGDVYICEKTGLLHVCDDTCREAVMDPTNELLVCTISGHCFDRLLSPGEMEPDPELGGATDEAEPFMGSGRFARAYLLGYNCTDEKELKAALRFC